MGCQCADIQDAPHQGDPICTNDVSVTLYRVDMDDRAGVDFCEYCAEDAMDSGLFTDSAPGEDEDDRQ